MAINYPFAINNGGTRLQLSELLLVVACCWILINLALVLRAALFTPLRKLPGPWYAPWTNLWLKFKVMSGRRSQYTHSLHQQHGPFVRISPNEVAVADPASVKAIYRVGSQSPKSDWYQKFNKSDYPGIFAMTDIKAHAARRRLFAQNFSKTSLRQCEPVIRAKVETAISKIQRDALAGSADVLKWLTFMATDVIGELSFGESFNMLEKETKTSYIRDLETAMMIAGMRAELGPLIKAAKCLPIATVQRALQIDDRMDAYGIAAIENHRQHVIASGGNGSNSLFAMFLDPNKNHDLSLPQISAEASNLIVAGSDTTAVSLAYLIWLVLHPRHREIKKRLLAEVDTVAVDASAAEIEQLQYLHAVIRESLRLYGAAPGSLPRVAPPQGATLGGFFIPEGTIVSTQAYTVHRDDSIFPCPEQFMPERWDAATETMKDAFFPFGLGSRVCLGIHLAMSELLLAAFLFFKTCPSAELAKSTTDASMEVENYFLIAPKAHRCEITVRTAG